MRMNTALDPCRLSRSIIDTHTHTNTPMIVQVQAFAKMSCYPARVLALLFLLEILKGFVV